MERWIIILPTTSHFLCLTKVIFRILLKSLFASRRTEVVFLTHMLYLLLRLAFIYFHPANRVCVFLGPKSRIVLISLFMHSFHKFHIPNKANPKTCGRSNICPG